MVASDTIGVDTVPPVAGLYAIAELSPYAWVDGGTVWYGAGGAGSFAVQVSAADATSGPERAVFPDATGPGGVVTAELAGPYQYEHTYTFGPSSTASGVYTVTVYDAAGHSNAANFAVARDAQPPTVTVQSPRAVVSPTFGSIIPAHIQKCKELLTTCLAAQSDRAGGDC